jgi:hypothetical protein
MAQFRELQQQVEQGRQEQESFRQELGQSKQKAKQKLAKAREDEINARELAEEYKEQAAKGDERAEKFEKELTSIREALRVVREESAEARQQEKKTREQLEKAKLLIEKMDQEFQSRVEEKCLEISRLGQDVLDQQRIIQEREKVLMVAECQGLRSTVRDLSTAVEGLKRLLSQKDITLTDRTESCDFWMRAFESSHAQVESLQKDLANARKDTVLAKTDVFFLGIPLLICVQRALTGIINFTPLVSKASPM